jgi:uncharacterized protein YkwD
MTLLSRAHSPGSGAAAPAGVPRRVARGAGVAGLVLLAVALGACRRDAASPRPLDRLLRRLDTDRRQQGLPALERQPVLDAAARQRAAEVAALPVDARLSSRRDIADVLRQAGVRRVRRATEYVQVLQGYADPAAESAEHWLHDAEARAILLDPRWDDVGMAIHRSADGAAILVSIFRERFDVDPDVAGLERRTEAAADEARRAAGLLPLLHSEALARVARAHSRDMAQRGYFGHEAPDGRGPADRVRDAGIAYAKVAENVAQNQGWEDPVRQAMDGWLQSPGHRANLLDPDFTHTGVGIEIDAEAGRFFFTQLFVEPGPDAETTGRSP